MQRSFRLSMAWLHTWFGLVLGFVLMVVFLFGTLSVFDREIDRWTLPHTRIPAQPMPSVDKVLAPLFRTIEPDPAELAAAKDKVTAPLPPVLAPMSFGAFTTHRDPVLALFAEFHLPNAKDADDDHVHGFAVVDPRDGKVLPKAQLAIGTQFFFPLHYSLHLRWLDLGIWIVGLAGLAMLGALVSGVVLHRKLFLELFTFRPGTSRLRSVLDLHNLAGVTALPFTFVITFSGLLIFAGLYLPVANTLLEPLTKAEQRRDATRTGLPLKPAGTPAAAASVDAMVADAKRRWAARGIPGEVGFLSLTHVGDANGYVSVFRATTDRVATSEAVHYAASTGALIREDPPARPFATASGFLTGLHFQMFEHWTLRWLFFLGGLLGSVCIATGFVFFVEKRKKKHAALGAASAGVRWVDAIAVTTVTGSLVATLAMLVANRLLPAELENLGAWEQGIFCAAWVGALLHAAWRTRAEQVATASPAWAEQAWAVAGLALAAVVLNALTTGDHLLRTLAAGYWPVAAVDLVLLASALVAGAAAIRLSRLRRLHPRAATGAPRPATPTPALARTRLG